MLSNPDVMALLLILMAALQKAPVRASWWFRIEGGNPPKLHDGPRTKGRQK